MIRRGLVIATAVVALGAGVAAYEQAASRQEGQEADWRERPRVFLVLVDFLRDRHRVREDISVADDDAFGIGGRAGRKHNLCDVVTANCDRRHRPVCRPVEIGQLPSLHRTVVDVVSGEHDPRVDNPANTIRKLTRRSIVDRHRDRAGELDTPVTCDPLRTVLAP